MRCVVSDPIASTGAPPMRFAPHPLRRRPRHTTTTHNDDDHAATVPGTRARRATMPTHVATTRYARGSGTAPAAPLAAAATRWPIAASLRVMRPPMSASAASRRITPAAQRPPNAAQRGVHVTMMASAGDVLGPSLHAPLASRLLQWKLRVGVVGSGLVRLRADRMAMRQWRAMLQSDLWCQRPLPVGAVVDDTG